MEEMKKNQPEVPSDGYTPEISLEETAVLPDLEEQPSEPQAVTKAISDTEALEVTEEPEDCEGSQDCEESEPEEEEDFSPEPAGPSLAALASQKDHAQPKKQKKPKNKKKTLMIVLSTFFLLLAAAIIAGVCYVYFVINPYASYDKIMPNVYCAGVNLGGMTVEEATTAIEDALRNPSYTVKVTLPDAEYIFAPDQEGVTLNGLDVAQQAYQYGRNDESAYGMYKSYHAAEATEYRLDAETDLKYSQDDVMAMVETIYAETYVAPTDTVTSCDTENHIASIVLGQPGHEINKEKLFESVCEQFEDMNFNDLTWDYQKVEIDTSDFRALARECTNTLEYDPVDPVVTADSENHNIIVEMGVQGYELDGNTLYEMAMESVEREEYGTVSLELTPVDPELVDITPAYEALVCDPKEPYYYAGDVVEGSNGYSLDWESAISSIYDAAYGDTLTIPMTAIPPEKTAAEIKAVLFRDTIGSYSTAYVSNANRTKNLELACKAINGTVLNSGETFSFNGVVGERTAAKGYKEATVYVGTESRGELGGGVCQVASTIYNAALYAQMEITSRAPHNFIVTYCKGGIDATVYWGSVDFCFKNSSEYPIRINAWLSGGKCHITIDGTNLDGSYVTLSSTQLSSTAYTTVYEDDPTKPVGYEEETVSPYTGYVYEAYQYIYNKDGSLRETNYLGKSKYLKRDRVVVRGTYTAPEPTPTPSTTPEATTPEATTPETTVPDTATDISTGGTEA